MMNGIGITLRAQVVYATEARQLAARFSTPPSASRLSAINDMIAAFKACGAWQTMNALYVMAAADEQAATRNWVADAYNLTATDTPTFTADRGYTPNGTSSYLDTAFNPTSDTTKFALDNAHMSAWHLTDLANSGGNSFDAGNLNSRIINNATSQTVPRPNNGLSTGIAESYATDKTWTRSASNVWEYYNAGADAGGGTDASTSLTSFNFGVGRVAATSFGVNQCAIFHFGSNLTAAQVAAVYLAKLRYLQAVGAV